MKAVINFIKSDLLSTQELALPVSGGIPSTDSHVVGQDGERVIAEIPNCEPGNFVFKVNVTPLSCSRPMLARSVFL